VRVRHAVEHGFFRALGERCRLSKLQAHRGHPSGEEALRLYTALFHGRRGKRAGSSNPLICVAAKMV
jgi:hypothetical protein